MEINEKKQKKEQQALIIRKYQQYLKLEKSLSPNTLEAYLTDLDKLLSFLTLEGIDILDVCLADLQRFAQACTTSAFIHAHKHAFCRVSIILPLSDHGRLSGSRSQRAVGKP